MNLSISQIDLKNKKNKKISLYLEHNYFLIISQKVPPRGPYTTVVLADNVPKRNEMTFSRS